MTKPSKSDLDKREKKRRWKKRSSLNDGDIFETRYGRRFKIEGYCQETYKYGCVFEDRKIFRGLKEIRSGSIYHPLDKTVLGVACKGEGKYTNHTHKDAYKKWSGMLKRVYGKDKYYDKYYSNVTVCEEWLNFQNFAEWYYNNPTKSVESGFELDKDLYYLNKPCGVDKIYSPKTCTLVPQTLNNLLRVFKVKWNHTMDCGKYRVSIQYKGVTYELGRFKCNYSADFIKTRTLLGLIEQELRDNNIKYRIDHHTILERCFDE